eukprot:6684025-Ditylum_brightwellii.AAC.1
MRVALDVDLDWLRSALEILLFLKAILWLSNVTLMQCSIAVIIFRKCDWNIEKVAQNTDSDDVFEVSLSEGDIHVVTCGVGARYVE